MARYLSEYEVNINLELQQRNKAIWKEVFDTGRQSLEDMPANVIFDGWRRSAAYGVDPGTKSAERVVSAQEMEKLLSRNAFLLDVSHPMMENLNNFVYDSGFNVAISNKNGIILTVMGDSRVVDSTRDGNWVAGADWSEAAIGNNGIGTCLFLDRPLMMIGYEHYCRCCHYFASAVAPIHDTEGELIGSIALCGRFEKIHSHTLGMVIAAAKAIEIQFKINCELKEKENTATYQEIIFNSITDGIISTGTDGVIIFCNHRLCKLLRVEREEMIGRNIAEIFDGPSYRALADSSRKLTDRMVTLNLGEREFKCVCNARHILNMGRFDGLVIALRDYEAVVQMARKIVNNRPRWMFSDLIGKNKYFLEMLRIARLAAKARANVFILGESGTGKDVLAQAIHNESFRANEPFVAVNCGAIPKDLIASELFGYSEGAFTGAKKGGHAGKFEAARRGTVFLDEIGEMPMDQQVVLLRVLDESSFTRVGSTDRLGFEARIISATNKNIHEAIGDHTFRHDLFYRLNVFTITTVPLRQRKDDIEELGNVFLKRIAENSDRPFSPLTAGVLDLLTAYDWPGNIRELQNVLEQAFIISPDGLIQGEMLRLTNLIPVGGGSGGVPEPLKAKASVAAPASADGVATHFNQKAAYEAELLRLDLERNKWNITRTCRELNISRTTLYRWMNKYNIDLKK